MLQYKGCKIKRHKNRKSEWKAMEGKRELLFSNLTDEKGLSSQYIDSK